MKINIPDSAISHFFEEPLPEVKEEFWALRYPIKAKEGDVIQFFYNNKEVAKSKISRIEPPGRSKCSSTGRFESRWKVFWKLADFQDLRIHRLAEEI